MPAEVEMLDAVLAFSAESVFGRPLSWLEVKMFTAARKTRDFYLSKKYYRDKDGNQNWPEWENKYPGRAEYLNKISLLAIEIRD